MKPFIAVLWVLSIALAIGLTTRLSGPDQGGSVASSSLDEAFAELDPLQRSYLISQALQVLGPDDLGELQSVLAARKMGMLKEEVRLVMLAWARFDAAGAYAWANEWPDNWKRTLTGQALWAWGYRDGTAAMRFVETIEDPEVKSRMRQNVIEGWMRSDDKDGVSDYIANFKEMGPRGRLTFVLAGEMVMAKGMDGAMRWVEGLPDDSPNDLKRIVFNHVSKTVAGEDDPERAADWFLEHRDRSYSKGALDGIIRRWVQHHDRPAAFAWLLEMSGDGDSAEQRDEAIAAGFRSWIQIDPDAALAWLLPMLPNAALDPAIQEALKRLTPTDIDLAMAWARRLDDESVRHQETVRLGARWLSKDPGAFNEWRKESDLPEETLQAIRRRSPRSQRGGNTKMNPNPAAAKIS